MKIYKKTLFVSAFFLGVCFASLSQGFNGEPTNHCVPPAPESAKIMTYESPVPSLATGQVNFSVPIYTLSVSGISIPVTFNYSTSGIKLIDDAFPVGHGWTLLPSLRITREMRGRPDERYEFHLPTGPVGESYQCAIGPQPVIGETYEERWDSEYDIFTIALPGGESHKWLMNRNAPLGEGAKARTLFSVGHDDIKVTATEDLSEIRVVDNHGNIYRYGTVNPGRAVQEIYTPEGSNAESPYTVGWMLAEIVAVNGDKILFDWELSNRRSVNILGGGTLSDSYSTEGLALCGIESPSYADAADNATFVRCGQYGKVPVIKKISSRLANVEFAYDGRLLSKVTVTDSDGNTVKTVTLQHDKLTERDALLKRISDSTVGGDYVFDYNEIWNTDFCGRSNWDWWDYYNGKDAVTDRIGGSNTDPASVTPYLEIIASEQGVSHFPYAVGAADRSVDTEKTQAMMLRKVSYPTGGYSTFAYEPHQFAPTRINAFGQITDKTNPELCCGGGLRISEIVTTTGSDDTSPVTRRYSYSDPVVTAVPSAATFVSEQWNISRFYSNSPLDQNKYIMPYRTLSVSYCSDYMRYQDGSVPIYYGCVTETSDNVGGKTEYYFNQILPENVVIRDSFGHTQPSKINRLFSDGPANVKTIVYKSENGSFKAVETRESIYNIYNIGVILNTEVSLATANNLGIDNFTPHWLDGKYAILDGATIPIPEGFKAYNDLAYKIVLQTERLDSTRITLHTENGDYVTGRVYTYVNGTPLIKNVNYVGGHLSRSLTVNYANPANGGNEKAMAEENNIVGVPISQTMQTGSATVSSQRVMSWITHRQFSPTKIFTRRSGGTEYCPASYSYENTYGNIVQSVAEDGYTTAFQWDNSGCYMLRHGLGIDYATLKSLQSTSVPSTALVTSYEYKPMVGVSAVTVPDGTRMNYAYDTAGRLIEISQTNRGNIARYEYHINDGGKSYVRSFDFGGFGLSASNVLRSTVIFDGLGREVSQVNAVAGTKRYLATLTDYDAQGRPVRRWLPAAVNSDTPDRGDITASDSYDGDVNPYSTVIYESSPRNQVTSTLRPGGVWHNGKHVSTQHRRINTAGECPLLSCSANGTITHSGSYAPGTLLVDVVTDEEGATTETFTDCRGLTVMTRAGAEGDWYDTKYIYNDFGDLVCVLPPKIVAADYSYNDAAVVDYGYFYFFDDRGRCTSKRLPGGVSFDMRYDLGGRVFATRDANMYADGRWQLSLSDRHGREALRLVVTADDATIDAMAATRYVADYTGGESVPGGYAVSPELPSSVVVSEFLSATYYDDYAFVAEGSYLGFKADANVAAFTTPQNAKGKPTGGYESPGITTAMYYDCTGAMAQTAKVYPGNYTRRTTLDIDNRGNVLTASDTLTVVGAVPKVKITRNTYDVLGFMTASAVTLNGTTANIGTTYNAEGRIAAQTMGNNIKRTFQYNLQGQLSIADTSVPTITLSMPMSVEPGGSAVDMLHKHYIEQIRYADGPAPRYDGLISARSRDEHSYTYAYDVHKRPTAANYANTADAQADFSESYSYDEHFGLTGLVRHGIVNIVNGTPVYGTLDKLNYYYDGNRLDMVCISPNNDAEGNIFDERAGYGDSGDDNIKHYTYDANGNMTSDDSRQIVNIDYNVHNLPTRVDAANGEYSITQYSGAGTKLSTTYFDAPVVKAISDKVNSARQSLTRFYVDDYVFEKNDALVSDAMAGKYGRMKYCRFDGGYFDADGQVHYYVPDFQGNTAMDIAADGTVVQQTYYYPYGEPWSSPQGQPWLYGGKERELRGPARGDSDFGARTLAAARGSFAQPDPLAEKYPHLNPYAFCAADPVNHTDPTGMATFYANGRKIGSDGVNNNDIYIVPDNNKTTYNESGTAKSAGHSPEKTDELINQIKENDGKVNFFIDMHGNKKGIYKDLIKLPGNSKTASQMKAMAEEANKKENAFRELGGVIRNAKLIPAEPGKEVTSKDNEAMITLRARPSETTVHTHPYGLFEPTDGSDDNMGFVQYPTEDDINTAREAVQYLITTREGKDKLKSLFIYDKYGIKAKVDFNTAMDWFK